MSQEIKIVKLISGEVVVGKINAEKNTIENIALLQSIQSQEGMQMMMVPYGYPFEAGLDAFASLEHALYTYTGVPADIKTRYEDMCEKVKEALAGQAESSIITQ